MVDVIKGGEMFRQLDVPILGVIENMSYYLCSHCGQAEFIFGEDGGKRLCQQLRVPLLAQPPLDPAIRAGGDNGLPIVLATPDSVSATRLRHVAEALVAPLGSISETDLLEAGT